MTRRIRPSINRPNETDDAWLGPMVAAATAATRRNSNTTQLKREAKEYVEKIKALRATLKDIQKNFKVANSKVPKDVDGMRTAKSERMAIAVFPPLPADAVSKHIKLTERWGIVAAARLWWRNLSNTRKPGEIVDKINSATSYAEFKSTIHWLSTHRVAEPLMTEDGLEVVYRQDSGPGPGPGPGPEQGILPGYSPPPRYSPRRGSPPRYPSSSQLNTRGGSKKKYKHRTKKYKKTKHL